jgi:hypothetical protein
MSTEHPTDQPNLPAAIQNLLDQEHASYNEFAVGRADAWAKLAARTALLAPLAAEATRQLVHAHPQDAANDGPQGDGRTPQPSVPAAAARTIAGGVSAKVAALMVAAGVAAGAVGFATIGPLLSGRALSAAGPQATDSAPAATAQAPAAAAAPPVATSATAPEAAASNVAPAASPRTLAVAASAEVNGHATDALTRERELIDTMRSGIANGRPADALAIGQEHARTFPYGALVEEREVLAITALVRLGRFPEARIRATRFKREHPQSFLRPPPVPEAP